MWTLILETGFQLYNLLAKKQVSTSLLDTAKGLVTELTSTAKRSGELTPEQEVAYDARLDSLGVSDAWTPEGG